MTQAFAKNDSRQRRGSLQSWFVLPLLACALQACHAGATVTAAEAQTRRLACTFKEGALPKDTLATASPLGDQIPIEHIVLIIQENHSFDSIFSRLADGAAVAPPGVTNDADGGPPVPRQHQPHECFAGDLNHSWNGSHAEYDNGLMDGFASSNDPDPSRAMDCYDESDVPYYYALARAFAISDAHFCSLMGPTDPNRLYSLAATSFGLVDNEVAPANDPSGQPYPNIFTELNAAHVTWKYYVDTSPPESVVLLQTYLTNASHYAAVSSFMSDAAAGQLPQVAIVEGHATSDGTSQDEHPPADIQVGQAFSAGVVNALMASPNWMSSALFFTYDEHGGFYDSVPPPKACPPDALQPILNTTNTYPAQFDRYGFRVPLIVVSPYAKRGYVSHVVTDHTSVLRFIEARFGLPAMTARDANADPLFDMFDFSHRDTSVPALPAAAIDPTEYSYCTSLTPANDTP